jgi:transcriptional regulator with XRE-family HTH domain
MPKTFGERIVYERTQKGWTQSELAHRAGIKLPTLNALEHGRRRGGGLAVEIAQKLARALGVTLDYLTGMYDDEQEKVPTAKDVVGV